MTTIPSRERVRWDLFWVTVLLLPEILFKGFVLMKLWDWFVLRAWPQAPHIGFILASGLVLTIGWLVTRVGAAARQDAKSIELSFENAFVSAMALLVGFILTLFL